MRCRIRPLRRLSRLRSRRPCNPQSATSLGPLARRDSMQNSKQLLEFPSLKGEYGPKILGPLPGPKARAIIAADDRLMSPSYTRSYPMVAKSGRGLRVEDV